MRFTLLICAIALCKPLVAGQSGGVPQDFGLRLAFGACTTDVADTFEGRYVRDLGFGKNASATLPVSDAELRRLDELITSASFFDYPSDFRPAGSDLVEPHLKVVLKVRRNGVTHTVSWRDANHSSIPEAARLRTLVTELMKLFRAMPAVAQLPKADAICL